jgi:hypothetical protein
MKLRLLAVLIIAFSIFNTTGCQPVNKTDENIEDVTAIIILPDPPTGHIVFIDTELARIEIAYDAYIDYLEQDSPDMLLPNIDKINWVNQKFQTQSSLGVVSGLDYLYVANLLEGGKAAVFKKDSKTYLKKIYIRTHSYICGPTCGAGYRSFYFIEVFNLRGTLFFEIEDWVS